MNLTDRAETLKAHLTGLPEKDLEFANSLLRQFQKKGTLSEKQAYWLDKLADKAQGIPDFTKDEPEKITVGLLTGMMAMFDKAAQKLKYPAIALQLDDGREVHLSRAGANSKNPGHIYVKVDKYKYVGKVSPNGQFLPYKETDQDLKDKLTILLRDLSRHPAEAAAKYGKLTGKCCFCSLPLTDPNSTAVGYGKTCAGNYGLPWGKK